MKTTLELPDELMRAVKIRAANENRRIKDVVADAIRRGLAEDNTVGAVERRVQLPLVECAHQAQPGEEITPERAAQVLLEDEAQSVAGSDS